MITLVTLIVIVLFSAIIGSTMAWVIARTLLDAMEHSTHRHALQAASLVRATIRIE